MRSHGGDPAIGPRLVAHLTAAGLVDVTERTVVNRMTGSHEKWSLAQLLNAMRPSIVAAGVADDAGLPRLYAAVDAGAARPDVTFLQARMHQVAGRVPELRTETGCSRRVHGDLSPKEART